MSSGSLSPLRKVRCFIPPPDSPLLTTYNRSLLPKLNPMKEKYQIFSKLKEKPANSNPETVYMNSSEVDMVSTLYKKIKRSRGEPVHERETSFVKDPLYKSIYNLKKESVRYRERKHNMSATK